VEDNLAYVVKLAVWLGRTLGQSSSFFADFSTEIFGTRLPDSVIDTAQVDSAFSYAVSAAKDLETASDELEAAAGSDNTVQVIVKFVNYGDALIEYFQTFDNLMSVINAAISPGSISNENERAAAEALANTLAKRLVDHLIFFVIEYTFPHILFVLKMLGLIEWTYQPADEDNELSESYIKKVTHLERIKDLIKDPAKHFKEDSIGWGADTFDPKEFFEIYTEFYNEWDAITIGEENGDPFLEHGFFKISRVSDQTPPGLQLDTTLATQETDSVRYEINDQWGIEILSAIAIIGKITAQISPPFSIKFLPPDGEVSGELRFFVNRNESARPFDILGEGGLINLSVDDTSFGVGLKADWDIDDNSASINPLIFSDIKGAKIKIGSSDSDGFVSSILSNADIEGNFDFGLEWQADTGLRIKSSGGIEIAIPLHKSLGIIEFNTIYLIMNICSDGTLAFEASADLKGLLGPLSVVVDRIGASLDVKFPEGTDAKYGLFDLSLGFKPPNGLGLSIDAAVVKGGGYLYFDFDKEEYAGAVELVFSEFLNLRAIGLLTTKMPDGSKGFSLLIVISVEFGSGIQLGFGFALLEVGGLVGLNRTMRLEPLTEGVRSGTISSIMFPKNIIENAPRIISDLRIFFPPEEGKFLIGPMAKLGWGTPTLISLSLGIIIEIPGNIAILGVLKVALPEENLALVVIQVNFIGAIEFDKKRVYFFACLFESRILFMTLEGEMGLLMAWGDDSNFVVSVGGFHPRYNPPPLPFPSPKRLCLSILNESWARIQVMGYFAVTSNSVQFGAHASLYFGFSVISIEGYFGFDALIQFSPFYMIVQVAGAVSLKLFGMGIFSIHLSFSLEGPAPWRAKGTGSISFFFFTISADFDVTWGEEKNTTLPPVDVMPIVKTEFEKISNWTSELPSSNRLSVSISKLESTTADLILHPVGYLRVSQKTVPLNLTIDKVGTQKTKDVNKFSLTVTSGGLQKSGDTKESFAMGHFQEMDESKKLSQPAFEKQHGGMKLSVESRQFMSSKMTKRNIRYETIIIDTAFKRLLQALSSLARSLFDHFLRGGSVSKSVRSKSHKKRLQPFNEKIIVKSDTYSVTFNYNNKPINDEAKAFESEAMAREYMNSQISSDPNLAGSLHIIPEQEVNLAA
jgi:hypothetical protein